MDQHQRELERKASAGDVEAQAKLLLERVRSGDWNVERVRLAAYLGDAASQHALTDEPAAVFDAGDSLQAWELGEWLKGLTRWSWKEYLVRVVIAEAYSVQALWRLEPSEDQYGWSPGWVASVQAAEDWVLCPCREHKLAAKLAARRSGLGGGVAYRCSAAAMGTEANAMRCLRLACGEVADGVPSSTGQVSGATRVRDTICAELLPWALGTADPLRDRVQARAREAAERPTSGSASWSDAGRRRAPARTR